MDAQTIKSAVDLINLIEGFGGEMHRDSSGWHGACPIHGGDREDGFHVFLSRTGDYKWQCFSGSCGHGDVIDFVMKIKNVDFRAAIEYLSGGVTTLTPADVARIAAERIERAKAHAEQEIANWTQALAQLRETEVWLKYHANLDEQVRNAWEKRGIPPSWQDFWTLGYDPDHVFFFAGAEYHTPTLTIPVFDDNMDVLNVRHRLLVPPSNGDKYRPERAGLPPMVYQADPGSSAETVLVVEGEIKAMVTFLTLDDPKYQVLGILGKTAWRTALPRLESAGEVIVCMDPDAGRDAVEFARTVGSKARVLRLGDKIDDLITRKVLSKGNLQYMMRTSLKSEVL